MMWKCKTSPHLLHRSRYDRLGLVTSVTAPWPRVFVVDGVDAGLLGEFVKDGHFLCQGESGQVGLLLALLSVARLFHLCCLLQSGLSCLFPHHRAKNKIAAQKSCEWEIGNMKKGKYKTAHCLRHASNVEEIIDKIISPARTAQCNMTNNKASHSSHKLLKSGQSFTTMSCLCAWNECHSLWTGWLNSA